MAEEIANEDLGNDPQIDADFEDDEEIIEELTDLLDTSSSLEFLDSKSTNLYLAFKAYHQEQNFEAAVTHFQQALEYALTSEQVSQADGTGSIQVSEPYDTQAKSKYWLAESYLKLGQNDQAIELFQDLIKNHQLHYLSLAAQRRLQPISTLTSNSD